jgi:hypothetical protein
MRERTREIKVRLTEEEWRRIRIGAHGVGLSLAAYLRMNALEATPSKSPGPPVPFRNIFDD